MIERDGFELRLRITGGWRDKTPGERDCGCCGGRGRNQCREGCFGWSCEHETTCTYCGGTGKVKQDRPLPESITGRIDQNIDLDINEDITAFFGMLERKYNDPNYKPKYRGNGSSI